MNEIPAKDSAAAAAETFTLTNDRTGESIKLPVQTGTDGPPVLDIRRLYCSLRGDNPSRGRAGKQRLCKVNWEGHCND